jgi:hypothetical protein
VRRATVDRRALVIVLTSQLAFWIGLVLAARHYPSEYDWRYMTISSLLYPDRNFSGHRFAQVGVVLSGLAGLTWALALTRRPHRGVQSGWRLGAWILGLGYLCMAASGWIPLGLSGVPKSHEVMSLAAFCALSVGFSQLTPSAARSVLPASTVRRVHLAAVLAGILFAPIVLAALTQAYVHRALPQLPWVNLEWRARGIPAYLSFALWQWVACVILSLFALALAALDAVRGRSPD